VSSSHSSKPVSKPKKRPKEERGERHEREPKADRTKEMGAVEPAVKAKPVPKVETRRTHPWVNLHPSDRNRLTLIRNANTYDWEVHSIEVKEKGGTRLAPIKQAAPLREMKLYLKCCGVRKPLPKRATFEN